MHVFDLAAHEQTRVAAVLEALDDSVDPGAILEGERDAYTMLYSGLDAKQLAVYEQLVRAGVLPSHEGSMG